MTDDLEEAGFVVEGIAQTLYAMSTSEACRDMAMARDMLSKAADGALAVIKAYVQQKTDAQLTAHAARVAA